MKSHDDSAKRCFIIFFHTNDCSKENIDEHFYIRVDKGLTEQGFLVLVLSYWLLWRFMFIFYLLIMIINICTWHSSIFLLLFLYKHTFVASFMQASNNIWHHLKHSTKTFWTKNGWVFLLIFNMFCALWLFFTYWLISVFTHSMHFYWVTLNTYPSPPNSTRMLALSNYVCKIPNEKRKSYFRWSNLYSHQGILD